MKQKYLNPLIAAALAATALFVPLSKAVPVGWRPMPVKILRMDGWQSVLPSACWTDTSARNAR
jgi:hypothetical protein